MTHLTKFDINSINRALVGFDNIFNEVERRISSSQQSNYPPCNIIKYDDNSYEIQLAVTGFSKEEISIKLEKGTLTISAEEANPCDTEGSVLYLHRGLALRNFVRQFTLAEYVEVVEAKVDLGMLMIKLERHIPEAAKPKFIPISN